MISALIVMILLLGLVNGWMYLQQPDMTFFPQRELVATPSDWGLEYREVELTAVDGVHLHGWYIPHPDAHRVLLFFHGNAGNVSHRGDSIAIFHRLGLDVFIIDYRGYGRSEGSPDERGLYRDATAAWRFLTEQQGFEGRNVVLFGRSLGGVVAAELASRVDAGALILESTLSSGRDFARSAFPLLSRVVALRYEFDTVRSLRSVHCPVLVLHSPDDEIMPYALGEKVYRAAPEPRQMVRLRGDHNSGFLESQPDYQAALAGFFATHLDAVPAAIPDE